MPFKVVHVGNYWKIYKKDTKTYAKPKFRTKTAAENQAKNWLRYAHRSPFRVKKVGNYWRIYKPTTKGYAKPKFKNKIAAQKQAQNWIRYAKTR